MNKIFYSFRKKENLKDKLELSIKFDTNINKEFYLQLEAKFKYGVSSTVFTILALSGI